MNRKSGRTRKSSIGLLFIFAPIIAALPYTAQAQRGQASVMDRAREAFNALSESSRKAIQNGLIWSGDYKGAVDGAFGRMTFNAIRSFEASQRSNRDGILTARDKEQLVRIMRRNITNFGFREIYERRSGITVGLPLKIVPRQVPSRNGMLFRSADGNISIRMFQIEERRQSLEELFARLRAGARGRRVTYKVLRDRFLVVSAETTRQLIYTRAARGQSPANGQNPGQAVVRGFTLTYAKSRSRSYDKLAIAISNSFRPFAAPKSSRSPGGVAGGNGPRTPARTPAKIAATAVAVSPNMFVSIIPAGCVIEKIGNAPATVLAHDKSSGLALLQAASDNMPNLAAPFTASLSGNDYSALFAEPGIGDSQPQISFTRATSRSASPGGGAPQIRIAAPLHATGGLVLSATGSPVGLLAATPAQSAGTRAPNSSSNQEKLASAAPPPARMLVPAGQIRRLLDAAGIASPGKPDVAKQSLIVRAMKFSRSLAPVICAATARR